MEHSPMFRSFARQSTGKNRRPRTFRPAFESLECRLAPCVGALPGLHDSDGSVDNPEIGTFAPITQGTPPTGSTTSSPVMAPTDLPVPAYSSLPGAKATLYLDFNGDFTASWGS